MKLNKSTIGENEGACSEFPPLMLNRSWTRGVPYRDGLDHTKPSNSIGNTLYILSRCDIEFCIYFIFVNQERLSLELCHHAGSKVYYNPKSFPKLLKKKSI